MTASLNSLYATSLGKIPDGKAKSDGMVVGAAAAALMLIDRLDDGRTGTRTFPVGTKPGEWRPVPPASTNVFSWVGEVRPFSLRGPDQFRTDKPPALKSRQYTREFEEVKALGAKTNSTRDPDQEALSNWIVLNPFGPVNQAFRDLSTSHGLSTAEQARLFAMTSLSSADAFIGCWYNKHLYNFWRPQTAIQEAATDGNPNTVPHRSALGVEVPDARVPRHALRLQLLRRLDDERRRGVLWDGPGCIRHHECLGHAKLYPLQRLRPRRDRRSHPHRLPLPERRRAGRLARRARSPSGWPGTSSNATTADRPSIRPPARFGGRGSFNSLPGPCRLLLALPDGHRGTGRARRSSRRPRSVAIAPA